jgi:hypothetical protein
VSAGVGLGPELGMLRQEGRRLGCKPTTARHMPAQAIVAKNLLLYGVDNIALVRAPAEIAVVVVVEKPVTMTGLGAFERPGPNERQRDKMRCMISVCASILG